MIINEDFITFEQAKLLKELGFDWECDHIYSFTYHNHNKPIFQQYETTDHYEVEKYWYAPTLAQAQKWLREVKGVKVYVKPLFSSEEYEYCISFKFKGYGGDEDYGVKKTWESALSAGIDEAIKLVKKEEQRNKP